MTTMKKLETKMKKMADEYFNDSKAVEMLNEYIDSENENVQNISGLQESFEWLQDKIYDLEKEVEQLKEKVNDGD